MYHMVLHKILLLLAVSVVTCQNVYITPSNCLIYYTVDRQIFYSFQSCVTDGNNTFNSWKNCQLQCCPNAYPYSFSQSSLRDCAATNSTSGSNSSVLIIVLCIIAFVIIALVVVCHLYRSYRQRVELQKLEASLPAHEKGHLTISVNEEKWVEESNPLDMTIDQVAPLKDDTNCSICLDTKTTIQLMCDHQFHEECAESWFKKKLSCPMCRTDVHFIKVKCEKMCRRYMLLRWVDYAAAKGSLSKICQKCPKGQKEMGKKEVICTIAE